MKFTKQTIKWALQNSGYDMSEEDMSGLVHFQELGGSASGKVVLGCVWEDDNEGGYIVDNLYFALEDIGLCAEHGGYGVNHSRLRDAIRSIG